MREATVTIGGKQWSVSIATYPWELAQGLGGIPSIPAGIGMLFDTGWEHAIQVTTEPMLFPIDICFLSQEMVVVDLHRAVDIGHVLTSGVPARYFLEVNAGELEGVKAGDWASVEMIPMEAMPTLATGWGDTMFSFMGLVMMGGFTVGMVRKITGDNPGSSREWEEGQEIASGLGNGIVYDGPQFDNGQFVYHTFTDREVTGTTFGARNLEEAKAALKGKRRLFGAPVPSFPAEGIGELHHSGPFTLRELQAIERYTTLAGRLAKSVRELSHS